MFRADSSLAEQNECETKDSLYAHNAEQGVLQIRFMHYLKGRLEGRPVVLKLLILAIGFFLMLLAGFAKAQIT